MKLVNFFGALKGLVKRILIMLSVTPKAIQNGGSNGFIYVVTGKNNIIECLNSIRSLRRFHAEPIFVFVEKRFGYLFHGIENLKICEINLRSKRPKVEYLSRSPFENTIYLDSDTIINSKLDDLFRCGERYHLAGVYCNSRKRPKYGKLIKEYETIPYWFSELNTGVLYFSNSPQVKAFLLTWRKYYLKYIGVCEWDQPSFRVALWESNLDFHVLPVEYNVRPKWNFEKVKSNHELGELHFKPRIFHMHLNGIIDLDPEKSSNDDLLEVAKMNALEVRY